MEEARYQAVPHQGTALLVAKGAMVEPSLSSLMRVLSRSAVTSMPQVVVAVAVLAQFAVQVVRAAQVERADRQAA